LTELYDWTGFNKQGVWMFLLRWICSL